MEPAGEKHVRFTKWAKEQGVQINKKISPVRFPGRGVGIAAQKPIKVGEILVKVPISALLTIQSIPEDFKSRHEAITVHGLLASFLAFREDPDTLTRYEPWRAVWPSMADFKETMPILWPEKAKDGWYPDHRGGIDAIMFGNTGLIPLPPAIGGIWADQNLRNAQIGRTTGGHPAVKASSLLGKQEAKLQKDFSIAQSAFPTADLDRYTYSWLIVNTRTFYYVEPGTTALSDPNDCMAMCPFADYFNHADTGCLVTFDEDGFTVTSDKEYAVGEEIYVSYGNHSNDFLLTEYGFILDKNSSDSLPLDDLVFFADPGNLWSKPMKTKLEKAGYLGNYTLTRDGPCHRTVVAARTQIMETRHWWQFVQGKEFGPRSAVKTDQWIIIHCTAKYADAALRALERMDRIKDDCEEAVQGTIRRRWEQILDICKKAMEGVVSDKAGRYLEFEHPGLLEELGMADEKEWVWGERFSDW